MNKRLTTVIATVICLSALSVSAGSKRKIAVYDTEVEKIEQSVEISFKAEIDKRAIRGSQTIIILPTLEGSSFSWSLPAIKVQNRRAIIAEQRKMWSSGLENSNPNYPMVIAEPGGTLNYRTSVDWQPWMEGGILVAEIIEKGCGSYNHSTPMLLVDNLALLPAPEPIEEVIVVEEPVKTTPPQTIGEKIAEVQPFVLPASEYEKIEPGQLFDEDRESSLSIYFKQGAYTVDQDLRDNSQSLIDLMTSIRMIENSLDSKVKSVIVAGFASPEGGFEVNDRLAWNRAVAVKEYILRHSELESKQIAIYNGSIDWRGLRMLVEESDMYMKKQVLDIIDNTPVWDETANKGRLGELMRLNGGRPYRYMYNNFFPKLRNAAFIKVYFENKE